MSLPTVASLTPMLRQYFDVKAQHPDAIVLYRMGDFFEMFFEDARRAAPILDVQLTARHKGTENEAPMCGVPHHALDSYLGKLLAAGLKVAICDQVEDPAQAKGLVRREVTRVVTPGTVADPTFLDGKQDNFLAALAWDGEGGAAALLDVSTGSFFVRRFASAEEAADELSLLAPRELLLVGEHGEADLPRPLVEWAAREGLCRTSLSGDGRFDRRRAAEALAAHFGAATLRGFGLDPGEPAVLAAAAALAYVRETQKSDLAHVASLSVREARDRLILDAATLANLEVFAPQRGAPAAHAGRRKTTLLSVLDATVTAPGGRLLRDWLRRPLVDRDALALRHDAVAALVGDRPVREGLRERLARMADPERLASRAVLATMTPREAAALRDALGEAPGLLAELAAMGPTSLRLEELSRVDPLAAVTAELGRVLAAEPAAATADGGVVAAGVDSELDRYRSLAKDRKRHLLALEARERERTGIASLKIRYNRVFGYYLEVTRANRERVPADYIRKQTLVNAERYVTPEIKELEEQILAAEERQIALEEQCYRRLLERIAADAAGLAALAAVVAEADVLAAFAEVADRHRYVQPSIGPRGGPIVIREGRHPVVEQTSREGFVPNDTELDGVSAQIVVLTGPNMGGKSTYLRQVALIVLLAQAGSFVPAASAEIGVVDRIFTRVGASDDLARGESTFMVEMIETANILRHATRESLVILDEVGRGTATFDGLSLAWAIVEHLHEHACPKTLFATHYHELTELAALLPRVVNRTMAVKEWDDKIVFLRRVVAGSADKSYGLHVARLAGLPTPVVDRAAEILANLEAEEYDPAGKPRLAKGSGAPDEAAPAQLALFAPPDQVVADLLRQVDVERLTPLAALNLVASLKSRLG